MKLENKVAIVTGSASGIGKATAKVFAKEGAKVVVSDIREDNDNQTVAEIVADGGIASYVKLNVTSKEDWENAVKYAQETYGTVNVLVNCAGIAAEPCSFPNVDLDNWHKFIDVNVTGPLIGIELCAELMKKEGKGAIVNIGSLAGFYGCAGFVGYSVSKAAIMELSRCAAAQYGAWGIRCNTVNPGWISGTGLTGNSEDSDSASSLIDYTPLYRGGATSELANAVLFLASDDASYVNGQTLTVDGGLEAVGPYNITNRDVVNMLKAAENK